MKPFLLLMRVQLQSFTHALSPRTRSSKHGAGAVTITISYIILALLCALYLGLTALMLAAMGLGDAIPAFAVLMGALAGVIFTFLKANGTLFGLADFDLVMSLPVSRRTVVASRVAALYGSTVVLGLMLSLPLWAVYLLLVNHSIWTVFCALIGIALAPAVPTAVATVLAFGVAAGAARFRHANIAYIVISLVAFAALMVAIYGFSFTANMNGPEASQQQLEGGLAALSGILASAWPPAGWMAAACATGSPVALAAFIAVSLAVPALLLEVMQRNYLSLNAALKVGQRGRALTGHEVRARARSASSPFKALVIKEYRTLLGIPSYAFNCLFGYLLMLIIAVALAVVGLEALLGSGAINGVQLDSATYRTWEGAIANALPWVFVFCAIASPSAACSLSIEGKTRWISASAPLPQRTLLGAKLAANALPVAIALAISAVILLVSGQVQLAGAAQILITGFGVFYLAVNIGLSIDARQPNFSWVSPNEVVKRSTSINVTVIGGMVLTFTGMGAALALSFTFAPWVGTVANLAIGGTCLGIGQLVFRRTCRVAHPYCL